MDDSNELARKGREALIQEYRGACQELLVETAPTISGAGRAASENRVRRLTQKCWRLEHEMMRRMSARALGHDAHLRQEAVRRAKISIAAAEAQLNKAERLLQIARRGWPGAEGAAPSPAKEGPAL